MSRAAQDQVQEQDRGQDRGQGRRQDHQPLLSHHHHQAFHQQAQERATFRIAEALEPLGYEFHMLATRLHETLPHLIALPYNPHDSANHMLALTQDIIERVGRSNKARQEVAAVAGGGDDKGTSRLSSEFKPVGKLGSEIGKIRV